MDYLTSLYSYINPSPTDNVYWCGNKEECELTECSMNHCIIRGCDKDALNDRRCEGHKHFSTTCTMSPICGYIHCNFKDCSERNKKHNSTFCIFHCDKLDCLVEHCKDIECSTIGHCALHCVKDCTPKHCQLNGCSIINCSEHVHETLIKELLIEKFEKPSLIKKDDIDLD